jgi:hypothetical protein
MPFIRLVGIIVLAGASSAAVPQASPTAFTQTPAAIVETDKTVLDDFRHKVADYMKDERNLPASKLKPTTNVDELENNRRTLQQAIQTWRANAKQGDIFTPASAHVFRKLLAATLAGPEGKKIIVSLNHAEPLAPANLRVNAPFPNQDGQPLQSVPGSLLKNLPILPNGLEYRIAGKSLALRDTNANLVVDYLPNALP